MFQLPGRLRWWRGIFALVLTAPLLAIPFVLWRASHAEDEAVSEVHGQSVHAFQVIPVNRVVPAGVEAVSASPGFRDLATYQETVVVSARAGLFVFNRNGALARWYRTGLELPAAELGAVSTGIAAGSAAPEVFIATRGEGVLAFNGTSFRQILPNDSTLRIVTSVLVLSSGRIHARLNAAYITAIAGSDADLWIGTLAGGLFHYRGEQMEDLSPDLPDPQVLSLTIGKEAVYAGTPLGVVEFRDGRRVRTMADGFFVRAVARHGETLFAGTEDEGIVGLPLQSRPAARVSVESDAPQGAIERLAELEGELYAVGEAAVYRYDSSSHRWRSALTAGPSVMLDRNVSALALSNGRLWVGYFDRGLDILDASLEQATHHEDDTLFCVNRIVAEPDAARTAVATANGLALFDSAGKMRQVMGRRDGLLSDHVADVAFREGGMVVATPAGLSFVDRSGVRSLYVFHGLVNNHVYTVAVNGRRTMAGTLGGASVLDDDSVRANYTTANSHLKYNWITAFARVGDEWFAGTYGGGVLRLDPSGEWHGFADLKDGFVVNPNAMTVSGDRLYVGSLDRGLFVYDRGSNRWSSTAMGLPSKNVTALAAGGGFLYVGTDNGLVRIAEGAIR
jgi:ligand-binding sensor domain-containing protein